MYGWEAHRFWSDMMLTGQRLLFERVLAIAQVASASCQVPGLVVDVPDRDMKWPVLIVLGAAQFLMVLDQAVMNVAISQLVEDFDTTVTTIQIVIALYALVMAALMLTGGKLGDLWGRHARSRSAS